MRYFICALGGLNLGIPAERAERILPLAHGRGAVRENGEAFISLPALFQREDIAASHGVVLKSPAAPKTVLLVPRIDKDMEIPEDSIRALPRALLGVFLYFTGVYFSNKDVFIILDTEKLIGAAQ